MAMNIMTNIYLWIFTTFGLLIVCIMMFIILIIIKMKTHAILELKAWMKKIPISFFFEDSKFFQMKAIKPDAGIIDDPEYGVFIRNEKNAYIDKSTRQVVNVYDAGFSPGINIRSAKIVDDLKEISKDERVLAEIREHLADGTIEENAILTTIKSSVNLNNLKYMLYAILPHNIKSEIEKKIAQGLAGNKKTDWVGAALLFAAVLGAIIIGAILLRSNKG
jgi:hypothetical protein